MALVSDISLGELCYELEQAAAASSSSLLRQTNNNNCDGKDELIPELISSVDEEEDAGAGAGDFPLASQNDSESTTPHGIMQELTQAESATEESVEAEEENDTILSFADFRRQSEELTAYMDNLKRQKLERERQDEELEDQNDLLEKTAAFSELDEMVNLINTIKTNFTPPEKEKPRDQALQKSNSASQIIAPFTGKGKYAGKSRDRARVIASTSHSDDLEADSTLASMSTQLSSSRGKEKGEDSSAQNSEEDGDRAFISNNPEPPRPLQSRWTERADECSSSDESEVG
jgi:vacuolar-type H+-ATPase subunit I/STV1